MYCERLQTQMERVQRWGVLELRHGVSGPGWREACSWKVRQGHLGNRRHFLG